MNQDLDFSGFFSDLSQRLSGCMKEGHVPFDPCIEEILDMLPDASNDFITQEILPRLPQYGITMLMLEKDEYLPAGTPEPEISRRFLEVIRRKNVDPEALYALNIELIMKQHKELFETLSNITYFALPQCSVGISCLQHTWRILRPTLLAEHRRLHPEKAAEEEPWVDEETIEFLRPYIKNGFIPGWVAEKALRLLVIDLGSYPVSEDVFMTTIQAIGVSSLAMGREQWLPAGSDATMVRMGLQRILQEARVDMEAACRAGLAAINQDVVSVCRNVVFFATDSAESLDDAGFITGKLLMEILMEERERFHPEALDDDEGYEPDEEMAQALRTYAKGGFVPSWIVLEHYQRLLEKYGDIAAAAGIRDATMQQLGVASALLDKARYISPGASQEELDDRIEEVLSDWDMERCYESENILPEYSTAYQEMAAALFFADPEFKTIEEAAAYFTDQLLYQIARYRIENHPSEVPPAGLQALKSALEPYTKYGVCPTFAVEKAVHVITPYVARPWYAEHLIWHLVAMELDMDYWDLPEDCYVEPGLDRDTMLDQLIEVLIRQGFNVPYIAQYGKVAEEDADRLEIFSHAIYFADASIYDDAEAEDEAMSYLMAAAQNYK